MPVARALAVLGLVAFARPAFAQARPKEGTFGGAATSTRSPGRPTPSTTSTPTTPAAAPSGRPMTVFGTIYDTLAAAPLAGATVQFVADADRSRAYTAQTDSLGHYRLPGLAPGRYIAGFLHPDVDALGVELRPLAVDLLPDSAAQFDFGVPGSRTLLPALCGANNPQGRGAETSADEVLNALLQPKAPGALTGSVHDADTGAPVPGAKLVVTWKELRSTAGARAGRG